MPDTQQPATSSTWLGFERDEVAYIAPMAAFLLIMTVGNSFEGLYPWMYVARTAVVAALLISLRKYYTRISWSYWWLGIIAGVLGIVQWIGMDTLLQRGLPGLFALNHEKAFNPFAYFTTEGAAWSWIAVRIAGASIVVPFMEELFWRDYLWRRMDSPNDFKLVPVGVRNWVAVLIVSVAFSLVHVQILTAIVWGLMIAVLLIYTRSLGACIIMHGTTNLLLAIYVLRTKEWGWW